MTVLIHIAGPTGSGKTTLGERIKNKFPFILIKDLDDIYKDIPSFYVKEWLSKKNSFEFYKNFLEKGINKFLNDNSDSIIILVGFNGFSNEWKDTQYININAKHKFYIEVSEQENLKRRFNRQIDRINNNREFYFNRTLNEKPLCIDFKRWKMKINNNDISYYKKNKYEFLNNEDIYQKVKNIIRDKYI